MFRKLRDLVGHAVLRSAGALGGSVLSILLITTTLTLTDAWSRDVIWYSLLAFVTMCVVGACYPPYFVGFLSFLAVFNDDNSETPTYLFYSTLGYLAAMIAIPFILLFRIQLLAVASLLLVLQFAIIYAYHLSVLKRCRDT